MTSLAVGTKKGIVLLIDTLGGQIFQKSKCLRTRPARLVTKRASLRMQLKL